MSDKITFKNLVERISDRTEKDRPFTDQFLRELTQLVESGLKEDGSVSISGFGKFELRWMKERNGVNPRTGEPITIPGQNKVVFKPYKPLRKHVNRTYARMEPEVLDEGPKADESDTQTGEQEPVLQTHETDPFGIPLQSEKQSDEDLGNLLIERESPISEEADSDETGKPLKAVTDKRLVDEVQKNGSFNWSYLAASLLVLLMIVALFYYVNRDEPSDLLTGNNATEAVPAPPVIEQNDLPAVDSEPTTTAETDELAADPEDAVADTDELVREVDIPTVDDNAEHIGSPGAADSPDVEMTEQQVDPGATLWSIADQALGDPLMWPWIYHLNIDRIDNPNMIQAGADLTVPVIDEDSLGDEEMRQVAYGYVDLYHWYRDRGDEEARYFLWAAGSFYPDLLHELDDQAASADLQFARSR